MSKLSFRARQLDAYKSMPVYRSEEIPEVTDVAAINRAVPQMPTGMEKDEETEHHLQRALSAQQVYGTAEALVIPVPEIDDVQKQYEQIYGSDYKVPKQYIHAQAYGIDQEIPDYDMDSEDEGWLNQQSGKLEITALQFEEMIDRLEKGSGQQVVTLQEAKLLLKQDDDLIITVYDYWLNKRLKSTPHSLMPTVKSEKRDGSTTNNPYVAFRRRTEKMQTRKNRKNDEVSYEKMLKLRRDLQRAVTMLEMIKKREKYKKELLQLTIEILDKRYEMEDFNGNNLTYAEAQKLPRPVYFPMYDQHGKDNTDASSRKPKRKYEKKKPKSTGSQYQGNGDVDVDGSTEDEPTSPGASLSDQEEESHPDGIYAFRRKKFCNYHAPLESCGNWPWNSQKSGGFADKKYRYNLTSIGTGSETKRCIGYARRRYGRGGRVVFDRAYPEQRAEFWDRVFDSSVGGSSLKDKEDDKPDITSTENTFRDYVYNNKWLHFSPNDEYDSVNALFNGAMLDLSSTDLNDIDPIIDVSLPTSKSNTSSQNFTPIVTAPSITPADELHHPLPTNSPSIVSTLANHISHRTASSSPKNSSSAVASLLLVDQSFDSQQKNLLALKKEWLDQNARRKLSAPKGTLMVNSSNVLSQSSSNLTLKCNHAAVVDSKRAAFALTALTNGSPASRGNGINHINGPTSKNVKRSDLMTNSTTANLRKLNFPLTPSSDTSETTPTSVVSDLITLNKISGESGDSINTHSIITSDKDYTDSAGLNTIPEVGSTMEVT